MSNARRGKTGCSRAELLRRRESLLGKNTPLFYDQPLHLVRGEGVHLYDVDGHQYLDVYNNVPNVGHCHPRVVEALSRQASTLKFIHGIFMKLLLSTVKA